MAGRPRTQSGKVCGAIAKHTGKPCQAKMLYPNGRCRFHGGPSTGPKTSEGRARALANLKQHRHIKFDPSRPFGTIYGHAIVRYVQDGRLFDAKGFLLAL